jgi:hypothetical protein
LFLFEALSIEVKNNQTNIFTIHPWSRKKLGKIDAVAPKIRLLERVEYFDPESTFSVASILSNGYVLFLGFGLLMMLCYNNLMPKLQEAQSGIEPNQGQNRR